MKVVLAKVDGTYLMAALWPGEGAEADVATARAYAAQNGYTVFYIRPPSRTRSIGRGTSARLGEAVSRGGFFVNRRYCTTAWTIPSIPALPLDL